MDAVFAGFALLGSQAYWLAFLTAVAMAAVAGLVPGLSASLLMALAVPFIVFNIQDPVIGIAMLATITAVEEMLDVLPIVAMGHPGGGQVTFLEARPLSSRGQAARVLGFVYMVSAIGGLIGAVALLLVMPIIKPFILQFSFAEIGAVGVFGVAMVGALSRGAMVKGILAAALGMLLSTVGLSVFTGEERFTFDSLQLSQGLPIIATAIGLFALPEMFDLMLTRKPIATRAGNLKTSEVFKGARLALKYWRLVIRHSLIGVFLGAIPGVGSRVVSWLSYGIGISMSKNRAHFGKGSYKGLVFSESVQSAKEGGQAIPTLALGLPGGQSWVFVLVAMLAYGVSPGPQMLTQHGDIVTLIVVSLVLGNVALAIIGMLWSGHLAKLTRVPYPLLGAAILPMALLAAFQETRHWTALPIVFGFAILGLVMKQCRWPRPPLILGFILGGIIEENLLSAISLYGIGGVLSRPLTIFLLLMAVAMGVFFTRLKTTTDEPAPSANDAARVPWRWSWLNMIPVFFMVVAAWFMWTATSYEAKASSFPFGLGVLIMVLAGIQFVLQGWQRGESEILDLGMLSTGADNRGRYIALLLGLIAVFFFISVLVGLQYGAIGLATLAPAALMTGRRPWAWGALTGGIIAAVVIGFFDNVMYVIWPEPILGTWLLALLS
ncbi:MAG: tripartite tricarboxylate transporter permease [Rhodospirillales bacterium]|jgi:TctA family transporter|nr:tripartite tricarboxylate transporter permease [Rhodospirillales bacterium]MBT5076733.1 tripartite tricarboxylate transporter permease [Rhodospirillales bacterium]MBT5113178.1 tripartite tricarboxylate transporter permease [Rhodospirillales bacterium]MBT5673054.1 tripartite tricarboxylate transporter permease [Rhodospirillales bacterium]MBT6187731.1 tripartite tricarboxylate transporter permease [Rhodospirillales bacterium]